MRNVILPLLAVAAAAPAAERKLFVSSFDRVRVEGPFRVDVTSGRSPAGTASGDPRQLDGIEVHQDGNTISVRAAPGAVAASPREGAEPVTVTLSTPALAAASLVGAGALRVAGMKADRIDLSVAGSGTIAVTGTAASELAAMTIGTGRITVAGRAVRTRIVVNGAGGVQADQLDTGELTVRLDGPGEVAARARFTASVSNTGLGRVTIAGPARCVVKAVTSGSVACGAQPPR